LRAWSSVRFAATVTPEAFTHGPLPMRERALVGPLPLSGSRSTLRYARQVFDPAPTAVASVWHNASAPRNPPRFPVTLVWLVTKKLNVDVCPGLGDVELLPHVDMRTAATPIARTA